MVSFHTEQGTIDVPEFLIEAVRRRAERSAHLTAATLNATGLFPDRPPIFPAGFLLELGAVLELGLWERQGLRPHLKTDLPTYHEAAAALAARAEKGSKEFYGPDSAPLSRRVLQVWMKHFAWEGLDLLQADFILGDVDEDAFADLLAEFLWSHRHTVTTILSSQEPPS